jgi:hypothetical protein
MDSAGLSPGQRDGGLVQRRLQGPAPTPACTDPAAQLMSFVPQSGGDYHVYMFEDSYVLTACPPTNPNCCPNNTPAPCIIDPNPDEYLPNRFVSRPFHVDQGTCTAIAYNFLKTSLKMAKTGLCQTGDIDTFWQFQSPSADRANTPFNLHEVQGVANKAQMGQNPVPSTPLTSFVGIPNSPTNTCFTPTGIPNPTDVNFYQLHQADSCTGASMADQ